MGSKRAWQNDKKWVAFGHLLNTTMENGKVHQHVPLIVRTNTIESLNRTLESRGMKPSDPIEKFPCSVDATHLVRTPHGIVHSMAMDVTHVFIDC